MRVRNSSDMPMPVSLTSKRSTALPAARRSSAASTTILPPRGVNLRALESRFIKTCFNRSSSPTYQRSSAAEMCTSNSRPAFSAWG